MRHEGHLEGLAAENARMSQELERLQEALENVRHALCVFDHEGRIAYCNRRYPEVVGLPAEKIRPGLAVRELIGMAMEAGYYDPSRTVEEIEEEFWRNLADDGPDRGRIRRNGRTYVVHPGRTASGNLVATFEDVTAQEAAEAATRQSEARLSAILEALPDCVKIFDAQGILTYINPKGLELIEASDLEALKASDHLPISPDYLAEAIDVHTRVMAGETVIWTYEILGMKGTRYLCEARAVPFHLPDGSRAHLSITRDMTERHEADVALRRNEERLRLIQDGAGLADFENDCGEITHCSDLFFEQVGLPVGDGTISIWQWLDLVHPEDRDRLKREMEEARDNADAFENTYRIIRPDNGEVRWIACRTKLLRDENGTAIRTIGSHRDITEQERSHEALRLSEERLQLVKEVSGLADFEAGLEGVVHISQALIDQLGLPPGTERLSYPELNQYVHPDDREELTSAFVSSLDKSDTFEREFRIHHGVTGEMRWIHSRTMQERNAEGRTLRTICVHLDITDRKLAEEALRESEERFRLAAEAAGLGVWDYDAARDQREWSDRLREIFGIAPDAPSLRETAMECIFPADRDRFADRLESLMSGRQERFEDTFRITRADDGRERWVTFNGWRARKGDSSSSRIIATVRDATDEKTAEARIRWSALHDPLTRLGNRALFQEELDNAIRAARANDMQAGVLLLDLDHFKQINDSLGHDVGDALLKMIAERLRESLRKSDTVARLGGDEFAIVVPHLADAQDLVALSQTVQERMRAPFVHGGRMLDCRVSAGAAIYPAHGQSAHEVLKNADLALYAAKSGGRSRLTIYEPAMRQDLQRQLNMVSLARDAVAEDRIIPYYQPKLDLVTGAVRGFEALLRWRTPAGRIGQPAMLAAAFEDLEVAAAISDRMIERAITDMRGWLDRGIDFHHVAVNASAAEFRRDNFAERILESLRRHAIPTRCFQIEVTETVFLGRGAEYVHRALALLNTQGVRIALDDFGTGYASLRHLKQFPVDIIKIDQSFVRDMEIDPGDEAIVRAVINLGRSLGIHVVAEGIESPSQAERLLSLGCDYGQGFLFSKAVPAKRVPALVSHWQSAGSQSWSASARKALRLVAGGR